MLVIALYSGWPSVQTPELTENQGVQITGKIYNAGRVLDICLYSDECQFSLGSDGKPMTLSPLSPHVQLKGDCERNNSSLFCKKQGA